MAILEVQDIHTYYGDAYVLQGLSLQLEQGQILGLLGRNGVGKTTLVNSIVGFTPPRRGKIVFKGVDITDDFVVRDRAQRHGAGAAGPARVSDARASRKTCWSPSATSSGTAGTWSASTRCSRACRSGATSAPRRCRAASSRCWRSAAG